METTLALSVGSRITLGILLLSMIGIEYGGWFLLRVVRGKFAATPFQQAFFRAGHAHAGVLVILALVAQILVSATRLGEPFATLASDGIAFAAIFIPAGFFFAATGKNITKPNRFIVLIYIGIAVLTVGLASLGIGLLIA